ncbi:patatin-like phospholipase family protein [Tepidibacter thalassicus]|uniref:Intein N-terminal splicing region n=1 Tax=Tepidibacter thalassicus DSM 15285 TaxID=1123350 RepID=A0A1M5TS15_9FIRM|nr:patatin-like phospholipase family protein [Tepidibacter thalassicus]SHH53396.1 intein N-terminal splicing region [Tepidibacter thalassicus DSM 15285]
MFGICLPGGGAKGAFNAGVIYGFYERGINFNVVSGTSIGAINGYYIYTNNVDKLKEVWMNIHDEQLKTQKICGKVIDNSQLINNLNKLEGKDENIKSFYVNYVNIHNKNLKEVIVDISKVNKDEALKYIKYSSLLPCRINKEITIKDLVDNFDSNRLFDEFREDVENGVYDGYNLDGGIVNNDLLSPFINDKVEKLFIISLKRDYKLPDYILNYYNVEDIVIIEPNRYMKPNDTLRFEKDFCSDLFNEGYEIGKSM